MRIVPDQCDEVPNSKLQVPEKFQGAKLQSAAVCLWKLEFGDSLELGF
jgi:hypothetical protein